MIPYEKDLIERFQVAYDARKTAKRAYVANPTPENAARYTAAVLAWDSIWSEMMSYPS